MVITADDDYNSDDNGFQLLGGEVYHYHTKLMMKEAFTGGRFIWHQDYGSVHKSLFFSFFPPAGIHMLSTTTLCVCVSGGGQRGTCFMFTRRF